MQHRNACAAADDTQQCSSCLLYRRLSLETCGSLSAEQSCHIRMPHATAFFMFFYCYPKKKFT